MSGSRSRSKTSKTTNPLNDVEHHDLNGNSTVPISNSDTSRKRSAEGDDINEPPLKKKNDKDLKKIPKRKHDGTEEPTLKRLKTGKSESFVWRNVMESDSIKLLDVPSFRVASFNATTSIKNSHVPIGELEKTIFNELVEKNNSIMKVIENIKPDILCIQELPSEYWYKHLEMPLQEFGLSGNYYKSEKQLFGNVILYNNVRYSAINVEKHNLKELCQKTISKTCNHTDEFLQSIIPHLEQQDSFIVVILKDKKAKNAPIIVGNTKLSLDNNKSDLKCIQASSIFWHLNNEILRLTENEKLNPTWILCGDMNLLSSSVKQICQVGYLDDIGINELKSSVLLAHCWHTFQHPLSTGNPFIMKYKQNERFIWIDNDRLQPKQLLSCSQEISAAASVASSSETVPGETTSAISATTTVNANQFSTPVTSNNNNSNNNSIQNSHFMPLACELCFRA